jgi:hypothetical protein
MRPGRFRKSTLVLTAAVASGVQMSVAGFAWAVMAVVFIKNVR